jgi:Cell wall-active antibiotics response LiaF, C-terminal
MRTSHTGSSIGRWKEVNRTFVGEEDDVKKVMLYTASVLIFVGVVSFVNIYFELHLWRIILPALLILLGVWLVFSPVAREKFTFTQLSIFDNAILNATNEHILMGIGEVKLDLGEISLDPGEHEMNITALIAEVKVRSSGDKGLWVSSNSLLTEAMVLGEEETDILYPFEYVSENYEGAETKVKLLIRSAICEVKVKHGKF